VKTNVKTLEYFEDSEGGWRWRAKAKNGEIVATGESHTRPADAKRAARDVFPGIKVKKAKEVTDGKAEAGEAEAEAVRASV
jgi:uncharacterized protein YegP (UPF0339 family)